MNYNLLEEKWIPVLYRNGKTERVGICKAFEDAHMIRQIAASNPMDRVALLRFLLAVLMWCKKDAKSSFGALDDKSAGIPENWLAKLTENKAAFNLLGDGKRFYQDESLKDKESRPIGDLLVEFPGADSVNHMRHVVHDGSYGFCPACCAMGILRLSVWAPANAYYPASVNPASAAYAFIEGKNLFQTLYANLPETNPHVDQAPWLSNDQPDSPDAVAMLAWRPRKLWLNVADNGGLCEYCGQTGTLVKSLCSEKGWSTPVTTGQQFGKVVLLEFQKLSDEYKEKKTDKRKMADKVVKVAPVILKCRMPALSQADSNAAQTPDNESNKARIARVFDQLYTADNQKAIKELTKNPTEGENDQLDPQDTQGKKFWIEDPHLLKESEAISLPGLGADVAMHTSQFWRDALRLQRGRVGRVTTIGPVVNKFTFQDGVSIALPDASDDVNRHANLSADCSSKLQDLLKWVMQNPKRQHPEIGSAVKLLTPNTEAQIRDRLSRINASTGDSATEDKAFLHEVYAPVVEQVIASVTPGSPLRRHERRNHALALLNKKINEIVYKANQPVKASTADVPAKPRRGRKKGGDK